MKKRFLRILNINHENNGRIAHTSKIEFTVELDENKIPESIKLESGRWRYR